MSAETGYFIFALLIQVSTGLIFSERLYRGIITKFMMKFTRFKSTRSGSSFIFRMGQITCIYAIDGYVISSSHHVLYWVGISILYIDDAIFGDDDDRWKRRWETIKNKIKWKMQLPQPDPSS